MTLKINSISEGLLMSANLNEIKEELNHHGYQTGSVHSIDRGLMHKKWIIETSKGPLFLKWYNPKRYSNNPLSDTWAKSSTHFYCKKNMPRQVDSLLKSFNYPKKQDFYIRPRPAKNSSL